MLNNYLRMAWRSLLKNRAFSFINIFGLGIGMAAFLFIVHYVRFEQSYEDYNPNIDNIYRISLDNYNGSEYVMTDCETHAPFGPEVKNRMPEVRDYVRMFNVDNLKEITVGSQKFLQDEIYFADPSVFEILAVHVLKGDQATPKAFGALREPFQTALTESTAIKYFGTADALGKTIEINKRLYHVTSVIEDIPANTHIKFKVLLSHASLPVINQWYKEDSWNSNNEFCYLLMQPGTDLKEFNE